MLFKRKKSNNWYFKFTINGKTTYRSSGTRNKLKAQEIADKVKADTWETTKGGEREKFLWQQAVNKYLQESSKKSIADDEYILNWLYPFLNDKYLHEINKTLIEEIITAKLTEKVSKSRVNRITTLINTILNKAMNEWEWISSKPHIRKFKEPTIRIRWISREEANKLIIELPDHLSAMMRFTLATGLRESNVLGLEWSQVDLQRKFSWIHPDQAKSAKAIGIPLNDDAIKVLNEQIGKHTSRIFTYNGKITKKAGTAAWKKALIRAEINNFRWHDLRHTWASWHVQNGTPLNILKELGGWSSLEMVQKYAHLAPEHLAAYCNNSLR